MPKKHNPGCDCCGCTSFQCSGTPPETITVEISGVTGTAGCDDSADINGTHVLTKCERRDLVWGCMLWYGATLDPVNWPDSFIPAGCNVPLLGALLGCRVWFDFGGADNKLETYGTCSSWGWRNGYGSLSTGSAATIQRYEIAVDFMIDNEAFGASQQLRVINTYVGSVGTSEVCSIMLDQTLTWDSVYTDGIISPTAYNWSGWTVVVSP